MTQRILWFVPLFMLSCSKPANDEVQGAKMLREARALYADGHYDAARDSILSLRQHFPMALEARRQAILLLDSIELAAAEGDTLKQEFYRRKISFDIERFER